LVVIHLEKDAARILKLHPRTLQRYRKDGTGPKFVRRGMRGIGYTDEALADWVAQHTHASLAAEYAAAGKRGSGEAGARHSNR